LKRAMVGLVRDPVPSPREAGRGLGRGAPANGGDRSSRLWCLDYVRRLLICAFASFMACQRHERQSIGAGLCSAKSTAVSAATEWLARQRYHDHYLLNRAHATDGGDHWNVWIPRAVRVMPAEGLIEVSTVDCTCRWVPLM
jgi:hypothetical protein